MEEKKFKLKHINKMATKYTSLDKEEKEFKKTVFNKFISNDLKIKNTICEPQSFENVLYLGYDKEYGDVFKAWDNKENNRFTIFFGIKGDEF